LLRNISQAIDPVIRKPEGVAESVKTIIPGLSQTVPARQTRFGEDVVRQGGPIRRGFTVPEVSTEKVDPIADTLAELDVHPQVPRARLVRDGKVVPLTREQEHTIVKAIGKARRAGLEQVINGGRFTQLPEDAKRRLVDGALADATREVNRRALTRIGRGSPLTVDLLIAPAGQR
jgi:hypothetical protein